MWIFRPPTSASMGLQSLFLRFQLPCFWYLTEVGLQYQQLDYGTRQMEQISTFAGYQGSDVNMGQHYILHDHYQCTMARKTQYICSPQMIVQLRKPLHWHPLYHGDHDCYPLHNWAKVVSIALWEVFEEPRPIWPVLSVHSEDITTGLPNCAFE